MARTVTPAAWLDPADARVEDLRAHVERPTDPVTLPRARHIDRGVPVYAAALAAEAATSTAGRHAVQAELVGALADGPGVVALGGVFAAAELAPVTAEFEAIVAEQRASATTVGDHFAAAGTNDRIWNALEKLAVRAPAPFTAYYANPATALVCEAWLGPGYQVTSQVNVVNPGGSAQRPHRDYHLGFMDADGAARYPAHLHRLSPALTLQGAFAHTDMPVETGPTMYLPGSQTYPHGYLVADQEDVRAYFAEHHVQLPLSLGDAVFFNPALLHAAGHNHTADVHRTVNLLHVSSAFGRAMESVDRGVVARAVFGALTAMRDTPSPPTSTPPPGRRARPCVARRGPAARGPRGLDPRAARRGAGRTGRPPPRRALVSGLLEGRVVLVAGGTTGVGAACARTAAREGAAGVVVTGRRTEPGERLGAELGEEGVRALAVPGDVADPRACRAAVDAVVAEFGRVDCLVTAAGLTERGTLLDTTPELFDAHIAVNLRGPFFLMQAAVADMVRRGAPGTVVSEAAHGGAPVLAPYVAAKAGLAGLIRNAAHAHRFDRIRINGLAIGWTDTEGEDATQRRFHGAGDDWRERAGARLPMGRLTSAQDAAEAVVFLLSDRSGVVTGSVLDWDQQVVGAHD